MTIWNMQLHPGGNGKWYPREAIKKILESYKLIGLAKEWKGDHGCPKAFVERMEKGDIVIIRRNGPLAIVRVVGEPIYLAKNEPLMWFNIARCVEILQIIDNPKEIIKQFEQETESKWTKGLMRRSTLHRAWNWKFAQWWYSKVTNQTDNTIKVDNSPIISTTNEDDCTSGRWGKEIDTLNSYFEGELDDEFYLNDYIYDLKQKMDWDDFTEYEDEFMSTMSTEERTQYNELKGLIKRAEQEIKDERAALLDMMFPNREEEDFDEDADGYVDWDD